jgi:hypothetical protein
VSCHAEPQSHKGKYGTACASCHSTTTFANAVFKHKFPLNHGKRRNSSGTCSTCHNKADDYKVYTCYGCHEHEPTRIARKHRRVANLDQCARCHPTGRGNERERRADAGRPGDFSTELCAACEGNEEMSCPERALVCSGQQHPGIDATQARCENAEEICPGAVTRKALPVVVRGKERPALRSRSVEDILSYFVPPERSTRASRDCTDGREPRMGNSVEVLLTISDAPSEAVALLLPLGEPESWTATHVLDPRSRADDSPGIHHTTARAPPFRLDSG